MTKYSYNPQFFSTKLILPHILSFSISVKNIKPSCLGNTTRKGKEGQERHCHCHRNETANFWNEKIEIENGKKKFFCLHEFFSFPFLCPVKVSIFFCATPIGAFCNVCRPPPVQAGSRAGFYGLNKPNFNLCQCLVLFFVCFDKFHSSPTHSALVVVSMHSRQSLSCFRICLQFLPFLLSTLASFSAVRCSNCSTFYNAQVFSRFFFIFLYFHSV